MKVWNPSFYDLSNGDSLVDGTAHAFQCHRYMSLFLRVSSDVFRLCCKDSALQEHGALRQVC